MTAPTIEQMLDELVSVSATWIATGRGQRVKDARLAILSYVAGLERERDEARNCIAEAYAVADVANDARYAAWAERDRYKADAERFRWLFRQSAKVNFPADMWLARPEDIDRAIADEKKPASAQRGWKGE